MTAARKPFPPAQKIADLYCRYVAEWGAQYQPEMTKQMLLGEGDVVPGDVCDDNMAMLEAMTDLGMHEDDVVAFGEVTALWNEVYAIAQKQGFRCSDIEVDHVGR